MNSRRVLFCLAFLAFAISFALTFQLLNLTVLFKSMGAGDLALPILWLIPPLTGMVIQPFVGYLSDKTTTRLGKRKPYLIGCGFLAAFSACLLPFTNTICSIVIVTFLFDCFINGSLQSLRALTADFFKEGKERMQAFSLQGFLAALGAIFGTYMPLGIQQGLISGHFHFSLGKIPPNLGLSYLISGFALALFTACCLLIKEKHSNLPQMTPKLFLYLLGKTGSLVQQIKEEVVQTGNSFLKILSIHSLSWVGIFIFWVYFALCIAQKNYQLPYLAGDEVEHANKLIAANLDSSFYSSIYQLISLVFTFGVFLFSRILKVELIHAISLCIGGIGMSLICFFSTNYSLILFSILIGIMWGSLSVLPYITLLNFLPTNSVGTYFGIFNLSITIPQIFCALLLPTIYKYIFMSSASYAVLLAGILITLSGILWAYYCHQEEKGEEEEQIEAKRNAITQ